MSNFYLSKYEWNNKNFRPCFIFQKLFQRGPTNFQSLPTLRSIISYHWKCRHTTSNWFFLCITSRYMLAIVVFLVTVSMPTQSEQTHFWLAYQLNIHMLLVNYELGWFSIIVVDIVNELNHHPMSGSLIKESARINNYQLLSNQFMHVCCVSINQMFTNMVYWKWTAKD